MKKIWVLGALLVPLFLYAAETREARAIRLLRAYWNINHAEARKRWGPTAFISVNSASSFNQWYFVDNGLQRGSITGMGFSFREAFANSDKGAKK